MRLTAIRAGLILFIGTYAFPGISQDVSEGIANADAANGERLFRQCKGCHTIDEGDSHRSGPNLYGILGRPVAAADGFRFSPALQEFGGEWSIERLATFLENPRKTVPRTRMGFRGLSDVSDRMDVIAFLNTMSNEPLETGGSDSAEDVIDAQDEDFGQLVVAEGVDATFYACTVCHSEMIVAQQGKTRNGWDELLEWMVEEQGMSELPEEERNQILDYLAEHYGTDRPNFPRP